MSYVIIEKKTNACFIRCIRNRKQYKIVNSTDSSYTTINIGIP